MNKKANLQKLYCLIPALVTAGILTSYFIVFRYAPFGDRTVAIADAKIQYLDFYAYLKDVMCGKNSIAYSFGKTLGGNNMAVFSYYLASPLNLLVIFFSKENLHTFYHLLVVLKLGLAAAACYLFIAQHWGMRLKTTFAVIFSVSYALSQYTIAQSCNNMWLDGVYMLPLMMLGVFWIVKEKTGTLLAVSVGISILFNWYTGVINCLFSIVWFFVESIFEHFLETEVESTTVGEKRAFFFGSVRRYIFAMSEGGLISSVLFVPTLAALRGGRAGVGWGTISAGFTGNILSAIQAYTMGTMSSFGKVSLYCGSMAAIACTGCFISKKIPQKVKIAVACFLTGMLLMFYWYPCLLAFSLLKNVESYYYRYSYLGIFCLLFLASYFFTVCEGTEAAYTILKSAVLFSLLLLCFQYLKPEPDEYRVYLTVIFLCLIACMTAGHVWQPTGRIGRGCLLLTVIVTCAEDAVSLQLLMLRNNGVDVPTYRSYVAEQQRQMKEVFDMDGGTYRISQNATRNMQPDNLTANYNEALAFGYWSISGYTSDPDNVQTEFLNRMGYPLNGVNMCITNTSILAADALLNVKYVLSAYPIDGLELLQDLPERNEKKVYRNPYCLPFAFRYKYIDDIRLNDGTTQGNPFEYQNQLYANLAEGEYDDLYRTIPYTCEYISERMMRYHLEIPQGNYTLYGNLPGGQMDAVLRVNDTYETGYAKWLSPSVFYIPVQEGAFEASLELEAGEGAVLSVSEEQFYALDLDRLSEVSHEIAAKAAEEISVENGRAKFTVIDAQEGDYLYTSIPCDDGWTITLNNEPVQAEAFGGCMVIIPLHSGKNVVTMRYHVPCMKIGILLSIAGVVLVIAGCCFEHKKNKYSALHPVSEGPMKKTS